MARGSRTSGPERLLAKLMLSGVALSALTLIGGLVWFMVKGPAAEPVLRTGLLLLMATPALRVAIAVAEALRLRDWLFVGSTVAVVLLLTLALLLALDRVDGRPRHSSVAPAAWLIDSVASRNR